MRWIVVALLLCAAHAAHSQNVQRCVAPDGKVTFTQTGCGTELQPDQIYDATNVPPSGGKAVIPLARPDTARQREPRRSRPRVRGECESSNMTSSMVRGSPHPRKGMTESHVKAIYGSPDNVSASSSGWMSYTWYNTDTAPYRSVDFDEYGCVNNVYVSQDRRREPSRRAPGTRAKTVRH